MLRRAVLIGIGALGASAALPRRAPRAQGRGDQPPGVAPSDTRAVLHERRPGDLAATRLEGHVGWSLETRQPPLSPTPETVVRAALVVPERQLAMKWILRRNDDKTLPASHTIEFAFTLPGDFVHGGIARVAGLAARIDDEARSVPLAGLIVKVIDRYFIMGLSPLEDDLAANTALLRANGWFDLAFAYEDGTRAALLFEKGSRGERAIADAFAAWAGKE